MRSSLGKSILFFLVLVCAGVFLFVNKQNVSSMKISSTAFADGGIIPMQYSCDGAGINPPLFFEGVPKEAQSLALVVDDPDAMSVAGKVWDHWVVYNIAPETASIGEGSVPHAMIGANGSGKPEYQPMCPPNGKHTYHFKLYALDSMLDLPPGASKIDLEAAMNGQIIEEAELTGTYATLK